MKLNKCFYFLGMLASWYSSYIWPFFLKMKTITHLWQLPSTHSWQEKDMNTYIHAHTHTRVKLIMKLFLPIPKLLLLEFVLTTRVKIYMQLWILNGKLGHYCCLSFSFLLSLVFQTRSVATCRHWKKGIVMLQKKLKLFLIADIIICILVCAVWKNIS